jgi:hypothetical protein
MCFVPLYHNKVPFSVIVKVLQQTAILLHTLHIFIVITFLCIKRCVLIKSEISQITHMGLSLYCAHGNKKHVYVAQETRPYRTL